MVAGELQIISICHTAQLSVLLQMHHVISAHHNVCIHAWRGFVGLVLLGGNRNKRATEQPH